MFIFFLQIKDKRRLNRKIECSKLNHKQGEEARRKRLERDNKSDPDPSYIFYRVLNYLNLNID